MPRPIICRGGILRLAILSFNAEHLSDHLNTGKWGPRLQPLLRSVGREGTAILIAFPKRDRIDVFPEPSFLISDAEHLLGLINFSGNMDADPFVFSPQDHLLPVEYNEGRQRMLLMGVVGRNTQAVANFVDQ